MKSIFTLLLCLGFCWMSYKQSSQTKDAEYNTEEDTHKAISLSSRELDLALQWCDKIWLMNEQGQIVVGIPKDLVLNGIFSKIFGNEPFFFDMDTASFKRKQNTQRNIFLKGHRTAYRWTKRALERKGYNVSLDKDSHILSIEKNEKEVATKQRWRANQQSIYCRVTHIIRHKNSLNIPLYV